MEPSHIPATNLCKDELMRTELKFSWYKLMKRRLSIPETRCHKTSKARRLRFMNFSVYTREWCICF